MHPSCLRGSQAPASVATRNARSSLPEMTTPFSLPPIVERELRIASRRPATYWSRVGAAAAGGITISWVLAAQLAAARPAMAGQLTFRIIAGIAAFTVIGGVL